MLASASHDTAVRLWDVATGKELPQSAGPGPVLGAALSRDGKLLVTGHAGNGVHFWDPATGKAVRAALPLDGPVTAVALSADGKLTAAGNSAGDFALWETAEGKKRFGVEADKQTVAARRRSLMLALPGDGRVLAVSRGEVGAGIDFYDTATGKPLPSLPGKGPDPETGRVHIPPHALAFAPDGRTFLTASPTDGLRLIEAAGGKDVRQLLEPAAQASGVAFAPDGRSLAAGSYNGSVWVWETATGGQRRQWPGTKRVMTLVALSADGRLLASSEDGGGVRVRHLASGKELRTFTGHSGIVTALAFAPGRLLSVSTDGTALIWDATGLKPDAKAPGKIEADVAWTALGGDDAAKAFETMTQLGEAPEAAVALLRQRLKPASAADAKRIDQLVTQLDDDDFEMREKASRELGKLGPLAEKALRKAAKAAPSAEATRRITELLKKIDEGAVSADRVGETRALEVLEALGTPEARKVLEELAKGVPDAALTQEAKASLERLTKRATAP